MNGKPAALSRRMLLALAALALAVALAGRPAGVLEFSPLIGLCVCAALEMRSRWLAPFAIAAGLTVDALVLTPRAGGAVMAAATALWLVLRVRRRVAPGGALGCALLGAAAGLFARAGVALFCRLAEVPFAPGPAFYLAGPPVDGLCAGLIARFWWSREA